jgi:hypothetical protein
VSAVSYRPRSGPELVDAAFQLYKQQFARFVTLQAVLYIPWLVLSVTLSRTVGIDLIAGQDPDLGNLFAVLLFFFVWYALMDGTLVNAAGQAFLGREVNIEEALRQGVGRFPRLVVTELYKWFVVGLGFIFFIIPGLILFARYFAIPATVVLEENGVGSALRRSRELAAGMKGRIVLVLVSAWLVYFLVYISVVALVAGLTQSQLIAEGLMMIVSVFVYPLFFILTTLLYYDARIRKEALDIELLAAQLGGREERQPV